MNIVPDLPTRPSPHPPAPEDDRRAVRRILRALSATWRVPAIAALAALLLVAGLLAFLRAGVPATTTYVSQLQFTFPEITEGRYPNGTAFTPNEVIEPAILNEVYNRLDLGQFGLKRDDFFAGFSIRPFAPTESEIVDRFRQRLADRRLSFSERERIETQMRAEMEQSSRKSAEIAFTVRRRFPLPEQIGRSVVQTVPLIWSQIAIEQKGVLRLPGASGSAFVLDAEYVKSLFPPVGIIRTYIGVRRLRARLAELDGGPKGLMTVREPVSGKTFQDIQRDLADLELFRINGLRAALSTYRFPQGADEARLILESRLRDLQFEAASMSRLAEAVATASNEYVQSIVGLKGRVERRGDGVAAATPSTMPMIGEGFLDRLMDLSGSRAETEKEAQGRISDLSRRHLELAEGIATNRGEQERLQQMLSGLSKTEGPLLDAEAQDLLAANLRSAVSEASALGATLARLEDEFAARRIGHSAKLYQAYAVRRDVISTHPLFNSTAILLVLSVPLLVFLGLWIWLALWRGIYLARSAGHA
jgi:hypothetical protein